MDCALTVYYDHRHEAKSYTSDIEKDMYAFPPPLSCRVAICVFCLTRVTDDNNSLESMAHPRNVGWGEIGLDYHFDNSPRDIQREVFTRQLRHAVRLGKPITVHTREADEDTESTLKAEVPKDHKVQQWFFSVVSYGARPHRSRAHGSSTTPQIHIHCFTDSPEFGQRLLDHFPNLYIGITGMLSFFPPSRLPQT
jgi:TatD DNase family protein